MKILITGANGMVASRVLELWERNVGAPLVGAQADGKGIKDMGSNQEGHAQDQLLGQAQGQPLQLLTPNLDEFDLLNSEQLQGYFEKHKPDAVIHFAAYTDVGAAEKERGNKEGLCWRINVEGTRSLLKANSYKLKANFIHISTDMVFSGSEQDPGPYAEDHPLPDTPPSPPLVRGGSGGVTWYGWTKNQAERLVSEAGGTIVRLIYPVKAKGDKLDYLQRPLKLFKQGNLYPLFTDQQVSLTFIDQLAEVLAKLIAKSSKLQSNNHVYHVSTPDTFSPYELVTYALEKLGEDSSKVKKSSIKEFLKTQESKARYPVMGGLKVKQTEAALNVKLWKWKEVVDELVMQRLVLPS